MQVFLQLFYRNEIFNKINALRTACSVTSSVSILKNKNTHYEAINKASFFNKMGVFGVNNLVIHIP
jgi:hypothetical protein